MWENIKKWLRKKLEMVEITTRTTKSSELFDGKIIESEETEVIERKVK